MNCAFYNVKREGGVLTYHDPPSLLQPVNYRGVVGWSVTLKYTTGGRSGYPLRAKVILHS